MQTSLTNIDPREAVTRWLKDFEAALAKQDVDAATGLFLGDGHWRDLVAFTWHIQTMSGAGGIKAMLRDKLPTLKPSKFRIAEKRTEPRLQ